LRGICLVHLGKDLVHTLLGRVLIGGQLDHGAHHLVNGLNNAEHLIPTEPQVGKVQLQARAGKETSLGVSLCDHAVVVKVVELEGPGELLLQVTAGGHGEGADELLEVNGAILVDVEHIEDIVRKGSRVPKREELLVDLLELNFREVSRGAI